jgi:hypothetical protein
VKHCRKKRKGVKTQFLQDENHNLKAILFDINLRSTDNGLEPLANLFSCCTEEANI